MLTDNLARFARPLLGVTAIVAIAGNCSAQTASTTQAATPTAPSTQGSEGGAAATADAPPDPEALTDPDNVAAGKALWDQQCRHCHGRSAYPGKAPKLKPRKYKPEFVYDRVTNGFRKMPPWKAVYSTEQRWAIVAYVMSRDFSP